MAIDITGGEGSLFWKAGIDTTDFDTDMQKITSQIQDSTKKQIQIQQQAAQGQKQIAQSILQSAGIIRGMDKDIESQVQHLSALQSQIQALKSQSLQLQSKGFDTSELTSSLDKVLAEIERIKNSPLDLKTGKVDVSPLLNALESVQTEFDKISGQSLQLKVGGINTASVEKAFTSLQTRIDSLNQTALDLKVKGVDTTSLTAAIDKAKKEFETLKGLTLNSAATLDITQFQQQYDRLQESLKVLESEKIQLKAEGIDTTQIEKDITAIRTQAASIQRQALKITVDDSSLATLEKRLETLKAQSLQFKAAGVDTTQLDAALVKVQEKIDKIKSEPVELRAGAVNLAPLSVALNNVLEQAQRINGTRVAINILPVNTETVVRSFDDLKARIAQLQSTAIKLKVSGVDTASLQGSLDKIKTQVSSLENISINASANLDVDAFQRGYQTITDEIKVLETKSIQLKAQGIDTTTLDRDITAIRSKVDSLSDEVFKVKVDDSSLITLEKHLENLRAQSLEFKTKGIDTTQLDVALTKVQKKIEEIKAQPVELRQGTVNLTELSKALNSVLNQVKAVDGTEVNIRVRPVDTTSVLKSFDDLKARISQLQDTTFELKLNGIDTSVLQSSLDRIKTQVASLENISIKTSASLDIEAFQKGYQTISDEVKVLETQSIELKAKGVDTTVLDRDISSLKQRLLDASAGFQIKVDGIDDTSFNAAFASLRNKVEGLKSAAISLKIGDIDTTSLTASLDRAQQKLDQLNDFHLTGTASLNDEAFQKTYNELLQEISNLEAQTIELKAKGLDTTAVEADIQRLRTSLELPPVDIPIKTGSLNEKLSELDRLKKEFAELSEIDRNSNIGAGLVANIQRVEGEVERINQAFQRVAQNAAGSLNEKVAKLNELKNQYAALSEVDRRSDIGRKMADNIRGLDGEIKKINSQFEQTQNLAKQVAVAIASYATLTTATGFVKDIVRVRGEFQQLNVAFTTMLGSKEKADKLMAEVTQFAATTPFELKDVAGATKQLLAFGIEADKIKGTLRSLGDISAGIGAPIGEIAYLFGTIKTQQQATLVDLKQFAQRGIPIYEELAKVTKFSADQLAQGGENIKVSFSDIEKAFQNLTAEGSKFGGLMEAQSKTLTGQLSNLSDAWNQMLNNIGQSNEGVFAGAIGAATSLVQNYDKVLDILKVLVVTYGSYKAAVIATTAVQAIQTSVTQGYTIAETLRLRAMLLSEAAMKLLNRTMLANPYVAVATGIAAVVSALLILNKSTDQAVDKQKLLNDIRSESQKQVLKERLEVESLVKVAQDETKSKSERLQAIQKINSISPEYLGNISLENVKTQQVTQSINEYIKALERKAVKEAGDAKKQQSLSNLVDLRLQKQTNSNKLQTATGTDVQLFTGANKALDRLIKAEEDKIKEIDTVVNQVLDGELKGEDKKQEAKKRTIAVIEDEIKALKDQQSAQSTNSKEYKNFQDQIAAKEKELEAIRGKSKSTIRSEQTEENKLNQILEKRKDLLQLIEDLKRGATQSGLVKEQSELDKINEKYDQAILKIDEFNKKVEQTGRGQKIGQLDINTLNDARNTELKNFDLKQDAEKLKQNLEQQKAIFEQFEEAKKQIGIEKANEMFAEQLKGFTSFGDFLRSEFAKLTPKIALGIGNVGDAEKFKSLMKSMAEFQKQQTDKQIEDFKNLLQQTANFADAKSVLDKKYQDLFKALKNEREHLTEEEYNRRLEALQQNQSEETEALKNSFARQTDLFKKLGQDLIRFTKKDLKDRLTELKKILADGFTIDPKTQVKTDLTPETIAAVQSAIQQLESLIINTDKASTNLDKIIKSAGTLSSTFSNLSTAVSSFNGELGKSLSTVASLISGVQNIAQGLKDLKAAQATGDSIGQIAATGNIISAGIAAISSIVGTFKEMSDSKKQAAKEMADFQTRLLIGEFEINEQYRERQRLQVTLNKTTLQALEDQKKLLEDQKKIVSSTYDELLKKLQKEQFISGQHTEKTGGSGLLGAVGSLLGFGKKTDVVNEFSSLAGKTFEEIEKLFTKGQLTDNAKALFEQLQKIKAEGADIDALLLENRQRMQELLTGTTADSISDSIVDGFAKGLNSAKDFAGTFEDLMKKAILNSLKFKFLEEPLKKFFDEFAASADSNGELTESEVKALNDKFNAIIETANSQFEKLQKVSGIDFLGTQNSNANSLQGAIKNIQEETAQLLAGQMGGIRLTAIESLTVARQSLDRLNAIQFNTAATVAELKKNNDLFSSVIFAGKVKVDF